MGGEQAASVLTTVRTKSREKSGEQVDEGGLDAYRKSIVDQFEEQGCPLYASARLWDDGIVDPVKSRDVLALSLSIAVNAPIGETRFGVFRM